MHSDKQYYILSFTTSGKHLADALTEILSDYGVIHYTKEVHTSTSDFVAMAFRQHRETHNVHLIVIGAVGIAVRLISPHIEDKFIDPAVLVIDDLGRFVISLLSGHSGGANACALTLAKALSLRGFSAEPVVTTATDSRGVTGIEDLLKVYHVPLQPNRDAVKAVNMHIAEGGIVALAIDPFLGNHHERTALFVSLDETYCSEGSDVKVLTIAITLRALETWLTDDRRHKVDLVLVSKSLVIGTGCKKAYDPELYFERLSNRLNTLSFFPQSVHTIATIELKACEPCIHAAAEKLEASVVCFAPIDLAHDSERFAESAFVKNTTGIGAVAGPCAYHMTRDALTDTVYKESGCTFSIGRILR